MVMIAIATITALGYLAFRSDRTTLNRIVSLLEAQTSSDEIALPVEAVQITLTEAVHTVQRVKTITWAKMGQSINTTA